MRVPINGDRGFGFWTDLGGAIRFRTMPRLTAPAAAVSILLVLSGCQTVSPVQARGDGAKEAKEALSAVAGALSGKSLNEEELRRLEKQMRTDPEAQTAVRVITDSVAGKPRVKYCPITGRRYAASLDICPEHGDKLKFVDE